ncbi:MAG: VanZ family protein [Prolixibacteraceae bacterium]|nr:VanZ family protein [Prolixibacteraceae bacterium]
MKRIITNFLKPFIWLCLMCYGLYIPPNGLPKAAFLKIPHIDKVVHFMMFFVLCILLFKPLKKLNLKYLLIAPVISLVLAGFFEITQQMITTSRSSNLNDFLANTAGIVSAIIIYYLFISDKKLEKYL